jgi:hypothetical protein
MMMVELVYIYYGLVIINFSNKIIYEMELP